MRCRHAIGPSTAAPSKSGNAEQIAAATAEARCAANRARASTRPAAAVITTPPPADGSRSSTLCGGSGSYVSGAATAARAARGTSDDDARGGEDMAGESYAPVGEFGGRRADARAARRDTLGSAKAPCPTFVILSVLAKDLASTLEARSFASTLRMTDAAISRALKCREATQTSTHPVNR